MSTCDKCRHQWTIHAKMKCRRYPPVWTGDGFTCPEVTPDWTCGEWKSAKAASRPRFVPPTVDEVREYCETRQNGIDPQQFVDWNSARGWKTKQGPIKDWQATVRTWEARKAERDLKDKATATAPLAASHKTFKEAPKQTAAEKARAAADLERMQRQIEARQQEEKCSG